jgi:hypothetical protein
MVAMWKGSPLLGILLLEAAWVKMAMHLSCLIFTIHNVTPTCTSPKVLDYR